MEHVQVEGITKMFEVDEMVALDEEARMIERIRSIRNEEVQLVGLPWPYSQYKQLFEIEKGEKVAPRGTLYYVINLKDGATPPLGPIYSMLAYHLQELNKCVHSMLAEGKIVHRKSPANAPIMFIPQPDGRLRLCVYYRPLNKLTILNQYS